jgi:hypothetical protein
MDMVAGKVSHWAVQLEWLDPDAGWTWIARYDTAGGIVHRDRNRIGAHEPVLLPANAGKAAREAVKDFKMNAKRYTEAYRAAKAAGRQAW